MGETYAHSLASLYENKKRFRLQVQHSDKVNQMFGKRPEVFRNSELIYNDEIGAIVHSMGFRELLPKGLSICSAGKSPNYLYQSTATPQLALLLRNARFSDDISKNFSNYNWSEYPLTADKFASWLASTPEDEEIINIDMSYNVIGQEQPSSSGIFDFFKALPQFILGRE